MDHPIQIIQYKHHNTSYIVCCVLNICKLWRLLFGAQFTTRPFSVGEMVVLQQSSVLISGQVAQVKLLRTILTTEDGTQV